MSHWRYAPGTRNSVAHSHREQEEAFVRAFESGPDGLELIAVGGPKPEGGDGMPTEARWPA